MNNKLLSAVLVTGIAVTGFASYSSADESTKTTLSNTFKSERIELTDEQKNLKKEAKTLIQKKKDGTELTEIETSRLEEIKAELPERKGGKRGGHRGMGKKGGNLTDEEKTALESMSDDEKKVFFTAKKEEKKAQKEAHKAVIDKLISGETLSTDEAALQAEMVEKMNNTDSDNGHRKGNRENSEIIKKLVNGESISDEEKATLLEMKAKHEERTALKETLAPIIEKKKAGTELSEAEQAQLNAAKESFGGKRGGMKGGRHGGERSEK